MPPRESQRLTVRDWIRDITLIIATVVIGTMVTAVRGAADEIRKLTEEVAVLKALSKAQQEAKNDRMAQLERKAEALESTDKWLLDRIEKRR
jgi:hypothetical protein